jgi:heme A synthase
MSTYDDDKLVENESSRVLGIGAGTFTVGFLCFATVVVWLLTAPQVGAVKNLMRLTMILISAAVIMILIFADRDSQFKNQTEEVKVRFVIVIFVIVIETVAFRITMTA